MKVHSLRFKYFWIGLCILTSLIVTLPAQADTELYGLAKKDYYAKEYDAAKAKFEKLLETFPNNGYLYYNLANVYFKMGYLGKALQYYEKARLQVPRFGALQSNLRLARERQGAGTVSNLSDYLSGTFYFWSDYITLAENRLLLIVASSLFWGLIFLRLFKKWPLVSMCSWVLFSFSLYILIGYQLKNKVDIEGRFAIVVKPQMDVKAIYMDQDQPLFQLSEGTKVEVIDSQSFGDEVNWLRIQLPEGQKGWVLASDLGVI